MLQDDLNTTTRPCDYISIMQHIGPESRLFAVKFSSMDATQGGPMGPFFFLRNFSHVKLFRPNQLFLRDIRPQIDLQSFTANNRNSCPMWQISKFQINQRQIRLGKGLFKKQISISSLRACFTSMYETIEKHWDDNLLFSGTPVKPRKSIILSRRERTLLSENPIINQ